MNEYIHYYHEDRTHLGLGKQTQQGEKLKRTQQQMQRSLPCPGIALITSSPVDNSFGCESISGTE